jgi:predicted acetyltransferase
MTASFALLIPSLDMLDAYADALRRGWSPDNLRGAVAAAEHLGYIAADPAAFVASLDDVAASGGPIALPDGSFAARLPGFSRWIWDGEFCGAVNFRLQHGPAALPAHVLGHIGFGIVPWQRGHGYAAKGVKALLPRARAEGLAHVDLRTETARRKSAAPSVPAGRRSAGPCRHS